jgi:CDP-6-deoxy-D-xylo-4-hexulose-3-dehydrase
LSRAPTTTRVRLHEPTFGPAEIAAAVAVLESTQVTSGDKVREMESLFTNGVMCNSGSSANLLAIAALTNPLTVNRLVPGDKVIVSALSWSTTVWPLVQHGLIPVIVDIDPDTLNIDPVQVELAIAQNAADVAAVMPVHVYGNPCDMTALRAITDAHGLYLIEDCCEALGAKWDGGDVGSFGDLGTFSFYFSHHVTTLEGGMVVAQDPELTEMMRVLRAHGWTRDMANDSAHRAAHPDIDPKFLFVNMGYNLRTSELNAAIGLEQMPRLDEFIQNRQEAGEALSVAFEPYSHLVAIQKEIREDPAGQPPVPPGEPVPLPPRVGESSWFGFPVVVQPGAPFTAKDLRAHFERYDIESRSIIAGNIARQPAMQLFDHVEVGLLENADHVMFNGFSLPCHQGVDAAALNHMIHVLDIFMQKYPPKPVAPLGP